MSAESAEVDPRLIDIAARLIWWTSPEAALADQPRFLAQAMTDANLPDMGVIREVIGDVALRHVLHHPPSGVFDVRSWSYWHVKLGVEPIPPLPRRRL